MWYTYTCMLKKEVSLGVITLIQNDGRYLSGTCTSTSYKGGCATWFCRGILRSYFSLCPYLAGSDSNFPIAKEFYLP